MSDSSVSRDYGTVTIQLSVLAMSPFGYGAFPWLCPSLEGISLRSLKSSHPCPALPMQTALRDPVGAFSVGGTLSLSVEE